MSTDTINLSANQYRDNNGHVFYKKGTMKQLMTVDFMLFCLFSPILFALIQGFVPNFGGLFTLGIYLSWFLYDRKVLEHNGAFVPSGWWFLFVPVYIFKRQNRNGNSRLWLLWYLITSFIGCIITFSMVAQQLNSY